MRTGLLDYAHTVQYSSGRRSLAEKGLRVGCEPINRNASESVTDHRLDVLAETSLPPNSPASRTAPSPSFPTLASWYPKQIRGSENTRARARTPAHARGRACTALSESRLRTALGSALTPKEKHVFGYMEILLLRLSRYDTIRPTGALHTIRTQQMTYRASARRPGHSRGPSEATLTFTSSLVSLSQYSALLLSQPTPLISPPRCISHTPPNTIRYSSIRLWFHAASMRLTVAPRLARVTACQFKFSTHRARLTQRRGGCCPLFCVIRHACMSWTRVCGCVMGFVLTRHPRAGRRLRFSFCRSS